MNSRERFLRCNRFQTVDHAPIVEIATWGQTVDRWLSEGMPRDVDTSFYVNGNEQASVDLLGGATTIAKVQLQNQRWGSGNDDSIIYFDGLNMYSEVPAPGALALLGLAGGLAARRRRRA